MSGSKAGWFSGTVVFGYLGIVFAGRAISNAWGKLRTAHPAGRSERRRVKRRTDEMAAWAWERSDQGRATSPGTLVQIAGARDGADGYGGFGAELATQPQLAAPKAHDLIAEAGNMAMAGYLDERHLPSLAPVDLQVDVARFEQLGMAPGRTTRFFEGLVLLMIVAICFLAALTDSAYAQTRANEWMPSNDGTSHLEADYSADSPTFRLPKLIPGSIGAAVADEGSFTAEAGPSVTAQERAPAVAASSKFSVAPTIATPSPTETSDRTPTSGASGTTVPGATDSSTPFRAPALSPTAIGTSGTATPGQSQSPTPATQLPTVVPGSTPVPTAAGTATSAPTTGANQTPVPTAVPATPTGAPTTAPTPVESPTAPPTSTPVPTPAPTAVPTASAIPTAVPTAVPTVAPTLVPTVAPTIVPTVVPTVLPTVVPTPIPTPTKNPGANLAAITAAILGLYPGAVIGSIDINGNGSSVVNLIYHGRPCTVQMNPQQHVTHSDCS